ncbi:MAG: hypothetical protein JNM18_27260 [Planctomycetaceae bacterium]|nr:hypothetical protein [Planctomycetaceae bacterium]
MSNAEQSTAATTASMELRWFVGETLGILAVFAIIGSWPVPDVNESHYLLKALHHWRPEFLRGDFFLESAEAHSTFYVLLGWLTCVMSLNAAAWCGRWITWLLLAVAWQRLSSAVIDRRGVSIFTAALYVTLLERFHMAGEWVVGGFESKGFAYAFVFLGLAAIVRQRWNLGLAWLGAATAIHVLVGGWSLIAAGVCWLWHGSTRPDLKQIMPGLAIAALCGIFGVWPALAMDRGVEPSVIAEAHQIYVFQRLPHHLTPFAFKLEFIERHALLFFVWIALCAFTVSDSAQRIVRGFVAGALTITFLGVAISVVLRDQPQYAAGLLRFYWFRLGDAVLPLGVSLVGTAFLLGAAPRGVVPFARYALAALVSLGVFTHLEPLALKRLNPGQPRSDAPNKVLDAGDWRDVCLWMREHTPESAVVLAPRSTQTFKWWARRAEVGCWKDVPQNARDLVEWWQRMDAIHATHSGDPEDDWYDSLAEAGETHAVRMSERYGASYILTAAEPPLALVCPYRNNSYAVYEVPRVSPAP